MNKKRWRMLIGMPLIFAFIISGCISDSETKQGRIQVTTEKDTYVFGELININATFINEGDEDIGLHHSLSYNLSIVGPTGNVFLMNFYADTSVSPVIRANSEHIFCTYTWNQTNTEGDQVPVGEYTIIVELMYDDYIGEKTITIASS